LREAAASEAAERSKLLSAFYEDHPELAQGKLTRRDEFTLTKERLNQRAEALLRPLAEQFAAQLERQQAFVNRFRFLSPALLMQEMLSDVAGAGQARLRRGQPLPVRVLFDGKPAAGVRVSSGCDKLRNGGYAAHARTGADGRAEIDLPVGGHWFVRSHSTRRHPDPRIAEWESFWPSLTFHIDD
jgi:hypothetical protein